MDILSLEKYPSAGCRAIMVLSKVVSHRSNRLSGGQRQRRPIARTVATQPKIISTNEPTANFAHKTREGILQLMKEINGSFKTIFIFSIYDWCFMSMAKRLVRIEGDRIEKLTMMIERRFAGDNASVEGAD